MARIILYAVFVESLLELLRPGGFLGASTDLGYGVQDTAMVGAATLVLEKAQTPKMNV